MTQNGKRVQIACFRSHTVLTVRYVVVAVRLWSRAVQLRWSGSSWLGCRLKPRLRAEARPDVRRLKPRLLVGVVRARGSWPLLLLCARLAVCFVFFD